MGKSWHLLLTEFESFTPWHSSPEFSCHCQHSNNNCWHFSKSHHKFMSMPYVYFEGEISAKSVFAWIRHYCKIISDQHTQDKRWEMLSSRCPVSNWADNWMLWVECWCYVMLDVKSVECMLRTYHDITVSIIMTC